MSSPSPPPAYSVSPQPSPGDDAPTGPLRRPLRAGHLPVAWRWMLAVLWIVVIGALGALGQEAFLVDSGPFWLSFTLLPFALPVAALITILSDSRRVIQWSMLAVAGTGAIGAIDLAKHHRGTGMVEVALAASALVGVLACALNRAVVLPRPAPEPGL